jgi:hypothetical protein
MSGIRTKLHGGFSLVTQILGQPKNVEFLLGTQLPSNYQLL